MMELVPLLASCLLSLPCKDGKKMYFCKPARGLSPDSRSACALISDLPGSETMRNNVCYLSHLFYGIFVTVA